MMFLASFTTGTRTSHLSPTKRGAWRSVFALGWVLCARLPSMTQHHSSCYSSAGVDGAHAIVCTFSRAPRTWRHYRFRDAIAFVARKFDFRFTPMGGVTPPRTNSRFRPMSMAPQPANGRTSISPMRAGSRTFWT